MCQSSINQIDKTDVILQIHLYAHPNGPFSTSFLFGSGLGLIPGYPAVESLGQVNGEEGLARGMNRTGNVLAMVRGHHHRVEMPTRQLPDAFRHLVR